MNADAIKKTIQIAVAMSSLIIAATLAGEAQASTPEDLKKMEQCHKDVTKNENAYKIEHRFKHAEEVCKKDVASLFCSEAIFVYHTEAKNIDKYHTAEHCWK